MAHLFKTLSLTFIFLLFLSTPTDAGKHKLRKRPKLRRPPEPTPCSDVCITGRKARRQARKSCPKRSGFVRCRKRNPPLPLVDGSRRGYRCVCGTPSPSPSPTPGATGFVLIGGRSSNISVLSCTDTALFVEVQDPSMVRIDNFIWNVPDRDSDVCVGCSSVARKVVDISSATDFEGLTCPTTCIMVTTVFATLSDLFSPSILDPFDLTALGDESLESLLGCELSTSRQTLQEQVTVRQGPGVPTTCEGFDRVNSDGRCSFSNCFVDTDGDPVDCLFCRSNCDNGCGPEDPIKNAAILDFVPLVFDFRESCCIHDKCYTSSFSKSQCDKAFLRDNLRSCIDEVSDVFNFIRLPIPFIGSPLRCPVAAHIYYLAVREFGGDAYADAQAKRRTHEESDTCTAQCPTTQRSGGQGTTTLTVDLMKNSGTFNVFYNMFRLPDRLDIFYEGSTIFTTGGLVSGSRTVPVTYSGTSSVVQVRLDAPLSGTAWQLSVACPP